MHKITASAKQTAARLTDALWPGRSLVSGEPARGALSAEDFAALNFITGAICKTCGQPSGIDLGEPSECAACIARPPPWASARAALAYDEVSRIPILALKRAGRRDGLKTMANWMVMVGSDLLNETDLIVPVPLHYHRLLKRGYNQAGWLATSLGHQSGKPVNHIALARARATPSQAGLSAKARHRNVAGAFKVRPAAVSKVTGKNLLLIDDVMTTGATLRAATKALNKAGATKVNILTLARVVRTSDITI